MHKQGTSTRQIALKFGIPYSTCHNYFFFREDEKSRLKDAWERMHGPLDETAAIAELGARREVGLPSGNIEAGFTYR